jgi:hypothetical protein
MMLASNIVVFAGALIGMFLAGDFLSTFFYHVPQHAWGKLHLRTHHDNTRSFWEHSIVSKDVEVLLDGFLGAVPYLLIAAFMVTRGGAVAAAAFAGLAIGYAHVLWRHTCELGWRSPAWLARGARAFGLVLPEDHNEHHRDPNVEFGDIFRFYDAPARALLAQARVRRRRRSRLKRLRAFRASRVRS